MNFKPSQKFELIAENEFTQKIEKINEELKKCENSAFVIGKNNCKISCRYYLAENARKSIIILHGFTEFIEKYNEMIWYFLNLGFNVFGYDQRGHGYSGREVDDITITHINNFEDYVSDLEQVIDDVVKPNLAGLPIYILSHSMGGAVAMLYLQNHSDTISKALLSSPLVMPQTYGYPALLVRAYIKKHAKAEGWNSKFLPTANREPNKKLLSDNRLSIARFRQVLDFHMNNDNYKNQLGSNRWVYESMLLKNKILNGKKLKNISTKVLIVSAECDTVVKIEPQKKLNSMLPHSDMVTIKNAKHTIFTCANPILDDYYKTVIEFLCS